MSIMLEEGNFSDVVTHIADHKNISDDTNISRTIYDPIILAQFNRLAVEKHLIPTIVLTVVMMALGIPGNLLVILVYAKRWRKTTSRIFILALAVCDFFNCIVTMPIETYFLFNFYQTDLPVLCKISRFMTFWTNGGSSLILAGIAVDRLSRICRPFSLQMSNTTAKRILIMSICLSLLWAWPSLPLYGTTMYEYTTPGNVKLKIQVCLYDQTQNRVKMDPVIFGTFVLCCNLILDIFFIVAYGITLYHIKTSGHELQQLSMKSMALSRKNTEKVLTAEAKRKRFRQRCQSASSENGSQISFYQQGEYFRTRRTKTTVMLFLVTVVFMLSFVPYAVLVTLRNNLSSGSSFYDNMSDVGKRFYQFFIRSYFLSNALNPVIYSFMSAHFRSECTNVMKNILCCR